LVEPDDGFGGNAETRSDLLQTRDVCLPINSSCVDWGKIYLCFVLENTRGCHALRLTVSNFKPE